MRPMHSTISVVGSMLFGPARTWTRANIGPRSVAGLAGTARINATALRVLRLAGMWLPAIGVVTFVMLADLAAGGSASAAEHTPAQVREDLWAIPSVVPMLAYVIRPPGDGPNPL